MTTAARPAFDLILVGGGLANGLIAHRLAALRPQLRVLVLESGDTFGGNHTWSFHEGDITAEQRRWTAGFVAHRWTHYHVAFPGLHRRLDLAYASVSADRFHAVLSGAGIATRFGCRAAELGPTRVVLDDGAVLDAGAVIDGRGPVGTPHLRFGYQKFLGQEVRVSAPHRLTGPIVMDATVDQDDGYRFVYVLPFASDRLLIEDTYYADGPDLAPDLLRARVGAYAHAKGWSIEAVEREEIGVLPITLAGDIDAFWADTPDQPRSGLRAALFHPTTGYSWAEAVRLADAIAALPTLDAGALAPAIRQIAERRWKEQSIFRAANRMLFQAGRPANRWQVMRRFYRFPEPMIARFYAGALSSADKARLLVGKPPVPITQAVRALMDYGRTA